MKNKKTILILFLIPLISLFLTGANSRHKEMYSDGAMKYLKRTEGPWDKRGRVVGVLTNPPEDLEIEFYSLSRGKVVYKYKAPGRMFIYASRFLPPGRYNITYNAGGYAKHTKNNIKVISKADCMLNLKFSERVFTNR